MKMFLVRHGTAESLSPGESDADRLLSPIGQREVTLVANYLASTCGRNPHIWASPLRRARQTAERIGELTTTDEIKIANLLVPEANPVEFANWLGELAAASDQSIVVVGHQPALGRAVAGLLGIKDDVLLIEPATIIELSITNENGQKVLIAGLLRPDFFGVEMSANPSLKRV
ncbi:MAG TPA: phosphohistidine phosphatase SixA [Pyrinomonadaceae bacterium]|nr:phosphohistidine phosphatase SixA [Pyrinomonadaceae bacterium]